MGPLFSEYDTGSFYDEMFQGPGKVRGIIESYLECFAEMGDGELDRKQMLASQTFLNQGITFTVYSDNQGTERIFPFDLIPRIIPRDEWEHVERGLTQRIQALNLFLHDIYHDQRILKEGIIPEEVVKSGSISAPSSWGSMCPRTCTSTFAAAT
jgi:uncharacterized circularly permuted ATP-grasp superfamily protein